MFRDKHLINLRLQKGGFCQTPLRTGLQRNKRDGKRTFYKEWENLKRDLETSVVTRCWLYGLKPLNYFIETGTVAG